MDVIPCQALQLLVAFLLVTAADVCPAEDREFAGEPVAFRRSPDRLLCYVDANNIPTVESAVFDVAFSPDGKSMVTADTFGNVLLRRSGDAEIVHAMTDEHQVAVRYVRFLKDGELLASLDLEGRLLVWSSASGELVQELEADDHMVASLDDVKAE